MSADVKGRMTYAPAGLFIGGREVEHASGEWLVTRDPATGEELAKVARGGAEDVDRAVRDAASAFEDWADREPSERGRILAAIAAGIRAHGEELARVETLDNGKPLSQARGDIEMSANYFEFYAGLADKLLGTTIPLGPRYHAYADHAPFGVTAHITPWNAPLHQAVRGVAPALAAGNVAVLKPSEETPLSCAALGPLAGECGLPPGVLNIVQGTGAEAGAALSRHPLVRRISFTGSVATGIDVMHAAADRVVPLTLELGGKSPNIVFADADLEEAAAGAWTAIYYNAGQTCSAGSRLLVERSVQAEMVERLVARNAGARLGPGIEDPDVGPLTTADQFAKVREYLRAGAEEGAKVASGGAAADAGELGRGYFIEPTIFDDASNQMRIAQEEIFGPVLTVIPFDSDEEATRIANDSRYGLVAGVWTADLSRAHRVSRRLEVGTVFVNNWFGGGLQVPFGGYKQSGFGREKGVDALYEYVQAKAVTIKL
jgi:aldehyde dehydrogenase (NAD+)